MSARHIYPFYSLLFGQTVCYPPLGGAGGGGLPLHAGVPGADWGCAWGGLGAEPGRVKSGLARRFWGRFTRDGGEFGAIFDWGGGVFRYSFLHCKDTKKSWNFQIVSRKNCTFGDKNCTFESFWCFLGECRSTKVLKAFSSPRLQSPFYRFSVTRYRLQFFYEPIIRREAWKIAKYVSKNIYYYIYNIYIIYK